MSTHTQTRKDADQFGPGTDECPDCGALLADEPHRSGCPATDPR